MAAGQTPRVKLPVRWVDIDDPSNEAAYAADSLYTYRQGYAKGFSPDGKTLFANLQGASVVFAIWADQGHWASIV